MEQCTLFVPPFANVPGELSISKVRHTLTPTNNVYRRRSIFAFIFNILTKNMETGMP